jgi:hypothetical protein
MKNSKVVISLALLFAMFLLFGATSLNAKTKISGKMTAKITKKENVDVGDAEGHMMQLSVSQGTNAGDVMDGAQFENSTFSDLTKGNGMHTGYGTWTLNGDKWTLKFDGKVTTTMSADGKPNTTFEGTFTFTGGEGKYENIKGGGTYKGRSISETDWETEWEGAYDTGM